MMLGHILLVILCCVATIQDIKSRKITNRFNVVAAGISLLCELITKERTLLEVIGGFVSAFVLGIVLWKLGAIKAGDAKFLWSIGIIKGLKAFWITMILVIMAGGVIALGIILIKGDFKRRFVRLWNYVKCMFLLRQYQKYEAEKPEEFPFSVPILVGCLVEFFVL